MASILYARTVCIRNEWKDGFLHTFFFSPPRTSLSARYGVILRALVGIFIAFEWGSRVAGQHPGRVYRLRLWGNSERWCARRLLPGSGSPAFRHFSVGQTDRFLRRPLCFLVQAILRDYHHRGLYISNASHSGICDRHLYDTRGLCSRFSVCKRAGDRYGVVVVVVVVTASSM